MKKIGIFGLWHLGLVLSASWSKLGNHVIGFDYQSSNVNNLKNGIPPIFEPFLEEVINLNMKAGYLDFSNKIDDLKDCDFVFLAFDTPVDDQDNSDTSILLKSIHDLKNVLKDNAIVIISSQSPVGFCTELRMILKEANSTLELAYSPENLRLGEAIECYLKPGRIILGTAQKQTEIECKELFDQIKCDKLCMGLESAEMVKHGINSFLATSIVFANHLADICEENNANIDEVVNGMKSDIRIGAKAYLTPGIGFSGGTLGRDLKVLDQKNIVNEGFAKLFGTVHKYNFERKFSIVSKIEKQIGTLTGKNIGIIGLTYKPGTSTLRRSLPLEIIDLLVENGAAVKAFDPKADYRELKIAPGFLVEKSIEEVALNVDMIVLLTEWPDFKEIDWTLLIKLMAKPIVFDTKNFLDGAKLNEIGVKYYSIGK